MVFFNYFAIGLQPNRPLSFPDSWSHTKSGGGGWETMII